MGGNGLVCSKAYLIVITNFNVFCCMINIVDLLCTDHFIAGSHYTRH